MFSKARLVQAAQKVFDSEEGRILLHHLIRQGHFLQSSYVQGERPNDTAFREGERNMVLQIMALLKMSPKDVEKLSEEAQYYTIGDSYDR